MIEPMHNAYMDAEPISQASAARDVLDVDGPIAADLDNYEQRPQQVEMAIAVEDAFRQEHHTLIEAGTGVGKSFAYLIPAIQCALRTGRRVVISTHTIALQEQLINKDIPFLKRIMAEDFTAELVKGRANYLGLRRLTRASGRQETLFPAKIQLASLWEIEDWAYKTQDGSLADLPQEPSFAVWDHVRSDSDDCMGRKCETFDTCFYQRMRRRAIKANLLVVNHAMLFSDIALRRQGASILPDYDYVVLDEGHTVEGVAADHLGNSISTAQISHLLNALSHENTGKGILFGPDAMPAIEQVGHCRDTMDEYVEMTLAWLDAQPSFSGRVRKAILEDQPMTGGLMRLRSALSNLREGMEDEEKKLEILSMMNRCTGIAEAIDKWHKHESPSWVYWIDVRRDRRTRITLASRPIDVGPELREGLFDAVRSVVLTSATMTTTNSEPFAYVSKRLGLEDTRSMQLGSPFNYREQVVAYVESNMPDPGDAAMFLPAVCDKLAQYLSHTEGRAFVLFTSYSMLNECAQMMTRFCHMNQMPLLVQGQGLTRSAMLERFRNEHRSVLFGTDTFWAGVDVPGESLSNVIIVKLPFASPAQPTVEARIERIREQGGNPFMEYQVPEAILKFKQGIGRLIRSRTDRGIVVILDPRVCRKPYGRQFIAALPDCEVVIVKTENDAPYAKKS